MFHFTTQQLIGGPRYSNKVRIGNWNEDESRFSLAAADYEARRSRGELLHLRKAREKAFQSQPVPHSYSPDGAVRFGDSVQLTVQLADAVHALSGNVFTASAPGHARVTAGSNLEAQARNVWVLQRPAAPRAAPGRALASTLRAATSGVGAAVDDVLRYGDRVVLACNPSLTVDPVTKAVGVPFVLHSQRTNNVLGSGRKGVQEVTMTTAADADAEWVVITPDNDALREGTPVLAGEPLTLVHSMSNQALAADAGLTQPTDFGTELDVHCNTYKRAGHVAMNSKGELPPVVAQPQNVWRFRLAETPAAAEDHRGFHPLSADALVARVRASIANACGIHGVRSLALAFAAISTADLVPLDRAKLALVRHGAALSDEEFSILLTPFAPTHDLVSVPALLEALRAGTFPAAAEEAVQLAWEAVQRRATDADGVTLGVLTRCYDAKFDPRVESAHPSMTVVEAASEFARQWPAHPTARSRVSASDWSSYHRDVAAAHASVDAFMDWVFTIWHVPGRGHWHRPAGLVVRVVTHNGSEADAVVPGSLLSEAGLHAHTLADAFADVDATPPATITAYTATLMTLLRRMGLGGIARIRVTGARNED